MKHLPLMCLALLCLLLTNCKKEETPVKPDIDPKITAFTDTLTTLYKASVLPGFAITVVKDGAIHYQQAFGHANVEKDVKYTNETNQPIGSISKTFIGVALMKAIEQGHFTLETNINDILPFEVNNPYTPDRPIQIKHLVTHTSGFEDSEEIYDLQYYIKTGANVLLPASQIILDLGIAINDGIPLGDYLTAIFSADGPLYDEDHFLEEGPGKVYAYSNIAASLAGYLIEVKTGKSYAAYVKEYILGPLNMKNTGYDRSLLIQDKLSTLYVAKEYPFPEYAHPSYPDGFLNTSNEALSLFLLEMMKGANGKGTILSIESYKTLFQIQSPDGMDADEIHGVFWDLPDNGRISHNGADPGVITFLSFDPMTNTGHIMMTNINDDGLGTELGVDRAVTFGDFFKVLNTVRAFEQAE